jgi:hypothetical protein
MCVDSVSNAVLSSDRVCSDLNLAQPQREKECHVRDCPGEPSVEYPNPGRTNDMGKAGYMWRTGPWGEVSWMSLFTNEYSVHAL